MQAERGFRVCSDDFVSDHRETLPRYKTFLTERDNPSSSGLQTKRPHGTRFRGCRAAIQCPILLPVIPRKRDLLAFTLSVTDERWYYFLVMPTNQASPWDAEPFLPIIPRHEESLRLLHFL